MTGAQQAAVIAGVACALFATIIVTDYFQRAERVAEPSSKEMAITRLRLGKLGLHCRTFKRLTKSWPSSPSSVGTFLGIPPEELLDGWGRPFVFYTDFGGGLVLVSYGMDGRTGGRGTNADIVNQLK